MEYGSRQFTAGCDNVHYTWVYGLLAIINQYTSLS